MNRDDTFIPTDPLTELTPRRPRGGRRRGAGRPPTYTEPLLRTTVRLPHSYVRQLAAFGRGNLSDGIRLLVESARTDTGEFWYVLQEPAPHPPRPGGSSAR
jgi:hypothetical protein